MKTSTFPKLTTLNTPPAARARRHVATSAAHRQAVSCVWIPYGVRYGAPREAAIAPTGRDRAAAGGEL